MNKKVLEFLVHSVTLALYAWFTGHHVEDSLVRNFDVEEL